MIVDTNVIDYDFETLIIDGLVLVNPREIGMSVACKMLDEDLIWESDIRNNIELYLNDIITEAVNTALDVLEKNKKEIINNY